MDELLLFRSLGDGRVITIQPMTFGKARLHIGELGSEFYDDGW